MTKYASVVLDVDSTLSQIEGIEWLSGRCDESIRRRISETTDAAMRGDIALEAVYGERLSLVRPTQSDVEALGAAYVEAITPGAREAIRAIRAANVRMVLVSGGLREAIIPLARAVGLADDDVNAVSIRFDADGCYAGYDESSWLARNGGKARVVESLHLAGPVLAVGDGITDAELKSVVDTFAAFVGVVRHEPVVQAADVVVTSFSDLPPMVLS